MVELTIDELETIDQALSEARAENQATATRTKDAAVRAHCDGRVDTYSQLRERLMKMRGAWIDGMWKQLGK